MEGGGEPEAGRAGSKDRAEQDRVGRRERSDGIPGGSNGREREGAVEHERKPVSQLRVREAGGRGLRRAGNGDSVGKREQCGERDPL